MSGACPEDIQGRIIDVGRFAFRTWKLERNGGRLELRRFVYWIADDTAQVYARNPYGSPFWDKGGEILRHGSTPAGVGYQWHNGTPQEAQARCADLVLEGTNGPDQQGLRLIGSALRPREPQEGYLRLLGTALRPLAGSGGLLVLGTGLRPLAGSGGLLVVGSALRPRTSAGQLLLSGSAIRPYDRFTGTTGRLSIGGAAELLRVGAGNLLLTGTVASELLGGRIGNGTLQLGGSTALAGDRGLEGSGQLVLGGSAGHDQGGNVVGTRYGSGGLMLTGSGLEGIGAGRYGSGDLVLSGSGLEGIGAGRVGSGDLVLTGSGSRP